jgi:hypothetical protein
MRTRHLALDSPPRPAASSQPGRISGTDLAEFPEPTAIT